MKKAIRIFSLILSLQLSLAQAQTFETQNQKALAENVLVLSKQMKKSSKEDIVKVAKYLTYIKLQPGMPNYKADVSRLLNSSLNFILCDNIENVTCLETMPTVNPNSIMRVDSVDTLGLPIKAGQSLDIEYYFTQGWFDNFIKKPKNYIIPEKTLAMKLAEKISDQDIKSIWMALYGIDDIQGSMSSVYKAVEKKVMDDIPVQAVVDVSDAPMPNSMIRDFDLVKKGDGYEIVNMPLQIDFSYIVPDNRANWAFGSPLWTVPFLKDVETQTAAMKKNAAKDYVATKMLHINSSYKGNGKAALNDAVWMTVNKKSDSADQSVVRMSYQYNATMDFMRLLNIKKTKNEEAMVHIEYPYAGIMHNKFLVFENSQKEKSVWTGTANIARTCMGSEENANMSIMIKNDFIANAFLGEFKEMYNPTQEDKRPKSLVTGSFHNRKRPNTPRNFIFEDGTQVRVHFSPTDDAEHKVILPLLYSARKGDQLRISMFGSGGFELVRALQAAVARGVEIKIAVDALTGAGNGSWIKSPNGNLFDPNPFAAKPLGSVEARASSWSGLNHHKTASLTRLMSDGTYQPETIIIGSQNWSTSGNDLNDENVVTITNKSKPLEIIQAFNKEFDEKIWTASIKIDRKLLEILSTRSETANPEL